MAFLNNTGLERLWSKITAKLDTKVDKVDGKGLSTNDYTIAEKNKLSGIATGANKTVVDSSLSSSSTNPVQNKVVNTAISNLNTLVGDKSVSTQISNAITSAASSTTPKVAGTAAVGSETKYARGDHVHPAQTSVSGNAGTATKLATARTISLAGSHTGSASFDGSGNITINTWALYAKSSVGNTNNYPYHRFAKLDTITGSYQDRSATYIVSGDYVGGGWGIFRLTLRTNNSGSVSTVNVDWIVRQGIGADFIQVGLYNVFGSTYADAFIKSPGTYAGYTVHLLESGTRASVSNTWTLINSNEVSDTTSSDAKTSSEAYVSIAAAGTALHNQAYSTIVAGVDQGTVKTAASAISATKATQDASGNVITKTYATKTALNNVSSLVGDTAVSSQITNATNNFIKGLSVSGKTVTYTKGDGSTGTITTQDTDTHYAAKNIVGSSSTATANVTAATSNPYLNLVENGAVRSTHRISGSGATTVKTDTSGNITISSTNTTYGTATTSANGLMSSSDKSKLDGIATGATKVTVDSALSTSSTNPVQNKLVSTEINSLKTLVGDTAVATQISNAVKNKSEIQIVRW